MITALYKGIGEIEISDRELRKLRHGEVLMEVRYCGVCGTDRHIYRGESFVKPPVVLGHEYAGIVVDKADDVLEFDRGDFVAVDPNIYCGKCYFCKKGLVNFCEYHEALGVTVDGGFAEYSIAPSSQLYKLPHQFDLSKAAFAEPLSCCLRGIQHAEIRPGDSVVIIGGGSIGLMMVQLAKLSGAALVILVEPVPEKRILAEKLGANHSFDTGSGPFENIARLTNGGADIVIECVGKKESVEDAVLLAGNGGRVILFGLAPKNVKAEIDLQKVFLKELHIHNSFLNPFTFQDAVNLLVSDKIRTEELISKKIELENITDYFKSTDHAQIKSQVIINKEE